MTNLLAAFNILITDQAGMCATRDIHYTPESITGQVKIHKTWFQMTITPTGGNPCKECGLCEPAGGCGFGGEGKRDINKLPITCDITTKYNDWLDSLKD